MARCGIIYLGCEDCLCGTPPRRTENSLRGGEANETTDLEVLLLDINLFVQKK